MTDLNAGMIFKKGDDIYLVAESSNQRWIVNIVTGKAGWLAKGGEGTIAETEKKGYTYMTTAAELIGNNKPEVKVLPGKIEEPIIVKNLEDAPSEYRPFVEFELMLKGITKGTVKL